MSTEVVIKIKVPVDMKEEIIREIDEIVEKKKRRIYMLNKIAGILKDEKKSYKELKVEKYENCC